MRVMGIDPATTTGWSVLDDRKLIQFGSITCPSGFTLPQKLNFFHLNISRLIDEYKPDKMAVEDVILGISGARTLAYLARINGVIVQASFHHLLANVELYDPTTWKSNSVPGLSGMAPKWKIQLEVARHFEMPIVGDFSRFDSMVEAEEKILIEFNDSVKAMRVDINTLKAANNRKRNPLTPIEKSENVNKIKRLEQENKDSKQQYKDLKSQAGKRLDKIGSDIYSQTGVSNDIADSICIALCLFNSLEA